MCVWVGGCTFICMGRCIFARAQPSPRLLTHVTAPFHASAWLCSARVERLYWCHPGVNWWRETLLMSPWRSETDGGRLYRCHPGGNWWRDTKTRSLHRKVSAVTASQTVTDRKCSVWPGFYICYTKVAAPAPLFHWLFFVHHACWSCQSNVYGREWDVLNIKSHFNNMRTMSW